MIQMTPQQARLNRLMNEMMVNLDCIVDDLERLANTLPENTEDEKIVKMVMCLMAGMVFARRGDAELMSR